ncbi:methyl-accepting chemotaxis protein [Desulfurivibrio sp. D14AmB]|uniref:methyl-accepting chemotaxis protein n=1 Tax=Desulfurivibrio sp. D14AmB TaxID=3374370 RepID=UPI00376F240D
MNINFQKNLSVRFRLAGFMCFLLMLVLWIAFLGFMVAQNANRSFGKVYSGHILPLNQLHEIDNLFRRDLLNMVEELLSTDKRTVWEEGQRNLEKIRGQIERQQAELELLAGQQESSWLTGANALTAQSLALIVDLQPLIRQRDHEKLERFYYDELQVHALDYSDRIGALMQGGIAGIQTAFDDSQGKFRLFQWAFLGALLFGILVSLAAGAVLIRNINEPFVKFKEVLSHVMQGDLTKRLDYDRNDEFKVLSDGFNQMADYIRDLVSRIQQAGIQVTGSINEIAAAVRQQEATSNEHASTTSEIAASTTEIAATAANLQQTMKKVNSLTQNSAYAAEEGHAGLSSIKQTMGNMEEATKAIVHKLSVLNEKAGNIAGVVKTINKIADQTNLLSLNAAIEAEKAGEYGAGFAVVATEIRRLADQTAVATFDIEQIVKEVQSAVAAGVMGIDKFAEDVRASAKEIRSSGEQLSGVIEQVQVLRPQIGAVNEGIEAQALGARQINEAISQMNEVAQQAAETITQTSSSINMLQQAAAGLQQAVSSFKIK